MPGWKPLIVCGNKEDPSCGFDDLVKELMPNLINNIVLLSTLAFVCILCWAGFKLLIAQGDVGERKRIKGTLLAVLEGYVWIMVAWLIVYTIINALFKSPGDYNFIG